MGYFGGEAAGCSVATPRPYPQNQLTAPECCSLLTFAALPALPLARLTAVQNALEYAAESIEMFVFLKAPLCCRSPACVRSGVSIGILG